MAKATFLPKVSFLPEIKAGDRLKFDGDSRWWEVREADERWAIATRQKPFAPKGEYVYTIMDKDELHRGPTDLLGQGWDVETQGGWGVLLAELDEGLVGISHRNRVPLVVLLLKRPALNLGKPDARYEVGL
jgi:hypothetical protein